MPNATADPWLDALDQADFDSDPPAYDGALVATADDFDEPTGAEPQPAATAREHANAAAPATEAGESDEAASAPPRGLAELDALLAAGFQLFPVRPRDKRPKDKGWRKIDYAPAQLREWVAAGGNVGVRLRPTDLVVDFDPRNNPTGDSLDRFAADASLDLSLCPTVATPSGGLHVFVTIPADVLVRKKLKAFPGLDYQTDGAYVVGIGSIHPNHQDGPLYEMRPGSVPLTAVPPLTEAGLALLRVPEREPRAAGADADMPPDYLDALVTNLDLDTYGDWIEIGMAINRVTGGSDEGLEIWTRHSMRAARPDTEEACKAHWESFDPNRPDGVGAGTIRHRVQDVLGYLPPDPSVKAMFDKEPGEKPPEERGARRLLTLREFLVVTKPAPPIVDGFLYGSGVFVLFGKWGLGKTYLALDLAQHVAHGMTTWHGRKLRLAGPVVYLALEGEYAIPNRIRAWHEHHVRDLDAADLRLFAGSMNLTRPETRESALRMLADVRPALVFADTLSAAMAGADENAAGAVGEVLEWSRRVVRETGAPIIWLHHPGKKEPNSARGSSTIEANTDGVLQLSRPSADVDGMFLQARKVRSSAPGHPLRLQLQSVALPGGGSDAVVVLGSVGDERERRLRALSEAVAAAGGRLGAKRAAEVVSGASAEPLGDESAARWIRKNLTKKPDPFYLLAREESGAIVATQDQE